VARAALAAGCTLSINTDAHSPDGLDTIGFGLTVARRGWATADRVINCFTLSKLRKFIDKKR
jgi:DNA polymerase (family 10)